MDNTNLAGGFQDPPHDAAHAFRAIMDAMARPGEVRSLTGARPPAPLSHAAGVLLHTLCDPDTPISLAGACDCDAVRQWIAFHTGAPLVDHANCMFAVGSWHDLMPLSKYPVGRADFPDRSATLIVETADTDLIPHIAQGPGIADKAILNLPETDFFQQNARLYPLGIDFFFANNDLLTALPRSTRIEPFSRQMEPV